jgi:hypothetical protein
MMVGQRGGRIAHPLAQRSHVGAAEPFAEHLDLASRGVELQGGDLRQRALA